MQHEYAPVHVRAPNAWIRKKGLLRDLVQAGKTQCFFCVHYSSNVFYLSPGKTLQCNIPHRRILAARLWRICNARLCEAREGSAINLFQQEWSYPQNDNEFYYVRTLSSVTLYSGLLRCTRLEVLLSVSAYLPVPAA